MKKKVKLQRQHSHNRFWLIMAVVVFIVTLAIWWGLQRPSLSTNRPVMQINNTELLSSPSLKLRVTIPKEMTILSRPLGIALEKNEERIFLDRIATDFMNLEEYLDNLDRKNKPETISDERFMIGTLAAARRLTNTYEAHYLLTYKVYVNGWVYDFSTTSPDLYSDLDQIAQSFQYLGD